MRRTVFSGILAVTLSLVACSDQPTEPRPPDLAPTLSEVPLGCTPAPTAASLLAKINQLLPRSPLRTSLIVLVSGLPPRFQDRIKAAVRNRIFLIQDLILRAYYAGRLTDGTSATTFEKVLRLIEALHCYVGLTPPEFPSATSGSDVVVGVVFPNSPTTTLSVPSKDAAVTIPAGAAPSPTTIVITKLPDSPGRPGPLRTSLDQYPFFYHFSGTTATGPVTFNDDVIAGICLKEIIEGVPVANLRLAHNVAPFEFGYVEILPRPAGDPAGLDCSDAPGSEPLGSIGRWERGRFAWAKKLFFPAKLHAMPAAQVVVDLKKVGGNTRKFSDFAIVDPGSNPATLDYNPDEDFSDLSAPPGGSVSPAPSVLVRSMNQTPIANVPVEFAVGEEGGSVNGLPSTTVLTDANGIASLTTWTLGETPGTYTVTATPPDIDQIGTAEPYHPAAEFSPASRLFTATAVSPIELSIFSGDNQTGFANQILTEPLVVLVTQDGEPVEEADVIFQVTGVEGSITRTTDNLGRAEANVTLGPVGPQTVTASTPGASPVTFTATANPAPPARIVLQWGAAPFDLDAHLTGPNPAPAETRFHVYYASPGNLAAAPFAALDRDDRDGAGPETITISQVATGSLYRFSVHDFSNSLSNPSSTLAGSEATVTVYLASGTTRMFTAPNQPGTLWTVFTLSGEAITQVNTMSYESNSASTTAFSIFGRTADAMPSDAAVIRNATGRHAK